MIGRDGTSKASDNQAGLPRSQAGGRFHQGLELAGATAQGLNTPDGTTAVIFRSDEVT